MRRVITILFVIAVIAGSWFLYNRRNTPAEAQRPEGITTAQVIRGPIEAMVNATGSLAIERIQVITFDTGGRVAKVLVQEGQRIEPGQELARLDTGDLELSLKQAQAALQVSQNQLARARKGPSEAEIEAAKANVESAKAKLNDLFRQPSAADQERAKLAIDQAKNSLWAAQGNRDAIKGSPMASGGSKDQAEAQVLNAELAVKIAEMDYQKLFEKPDTATVRAAQAQVTTAESNLAALLSSPSPEDIAVAEAQVAQAQVGVDIAQKRLNDAVIVAPFGGLLVSLDLHDADIVSPNKPIGTIVDDSGYHIEVNIDETEISQLEIGQPVRITLDAFPDQRLEGRVSDINLLGDNTQGIVQYKVTVALSPTELPIKPFMTAAVDIIVDQKDSVLLVPNRALRRDQEGKYVEVLENNTPKRVNVKTGVSSAESTEITDGLTEGQEVITGRPRENIFGGGPFGG